MLQYDLIRCSTYCVRFYYSIRHAAADVGTAFSGCHLAASMAVAPEGTRAREVSLCLLL